MTKVSIILSIYNSEQYLEKCLESLVSQTLDSIEIIAINDGSTDNSENIIDKYITKYPFIKKVNKQNGGLSDARNFGLTYASGDYIGFVDSDDYISPNMYEKMYNLAQNKNLDLVECDFIWDFKNKHRKLSSNLVTKAFQEKISHNKIDYGKKYSNIRSFFIDGRVMVCNKLIKKEIILSNNITFPKGLIYEDIEFFYKLTPFIKKYDLISDHLYHYLQREDSIINNQNEKNTDIFIILNNILNFYKSKNLYYNFKYELEYLYIRFLMGSSFLRIIKIKHSKLKKELLRKSIEELYSKFPNWKNNEILKENKSLKNIYYKSINKFTYKIYSVIFRII